MNEIFLFSRICTLDYFLYWFSSNYCNFTVRLKYSENILAFGFFLPSPRILHNLITDWLYLPDRLGCRPIDTLPDSRSIGLLFHFFRIFGKLFWECFMPIKWMCFPYNVQNSNTLISLNWKKVWKFKSTNKIASNLQNSIEGPLGQKDLIGLHKTPIDRTFF